MNGRNATTSKSIVQCVVLTIFTVIAVAAGMWALTAMGEGDRVLYEEGVKGLDSASELGEGLAVMRMNIRDLILETTTEGNQRCSGIHDQWVDTLRKEMAIIQRLSQGHSDREKLAADAETKMEAYFREVDQVRNLAVANKNAEAMKYLKTTAVPASGAFGDALGQLKDVTRQVTSDQMVTNDKLTNTGITLMVLCAIVSIALCAIFASLMARQPTESFPTAGGQGSGFSASFVAPPVSQETGSRFCSQCGSQLKAGSKFCHKCGHGV